MPEETETTADVLTALKESVSEAWAVIDADPGLDDDQRAEMVRKFESIEEDIEEARKLIPVSSEDE